MEYFWAKCYSNVLTVSKNRYLGWLLILWLKNKLRPAVLAFNLHLHKQINAHKRIDKVTSLSGSPSIVDLYTASDDEEPHCCWCSTVTKWLQGLRMMTNSSADTSDTSGDIYATRYSAKGSSSSKTQPKKKGFSKWISIILMFEFTNLFSEAISARRQVSSPFIWFRNHNDVISIKIQIKYSQINCDSDVPTCGWNLKWGG